MSSHTVAGAPLVEAAGALVWHVRQGRLQVLLVHRPRYADWSWPKGKLEPGECAPAAAVREVAEETGYDVVLGIPLPTLSYDLADGRRKRVRYWAAQVGGSPQGDAGHARPPIAPASPDEVDGARWLDAEVAARRLTRAADRGPLTSVLKAYEKQRLATHVVTLVRHGRARRRQGWPGDDADRPLTPVGRAQAEALVPLLSAFGVTDVVSSPWERCRATVAPYAEAARVPLHTVPGLTEAEHAADPERAANQLAAALWSHTDVVVCTHRPVLPTVLGLLAEHARPKASQALPTEDPYLQPGEALVAHVAARPEGPRVVAMELHRSPVGR